MPNRENAIMQSMEPTCADTLPDLVFTEPQRQQLSPAHHRVLALRELRHPSIR